MLQDKEIDNHISLTHCVCAEPPPAITVPSNVTAYPGANVVLTCLVTSTVHFNLTWQRGDVDAKLDHRIHVTANLSLEIQRVTPDDVGWYTCIAANEGGVSASRVYLNVQGQCVCVFEKAIHYNRVIITTVLLLSAAYSHIRSAYAII